MTKRLSKWVAAKTVRVVLGVSTFGLTTSAQERPAGAVIETHPAETLSLEELKAKKTEVEGSTALTESVKKSYDNPKQHWSIQKPILPN